MSETDNRPRAFVVTYFIEGQLGFMDFAYRLHALAKPYRLTVICCRPLEAREVHLPGVRIVVLAPRIRGMLGFVDYWLRVACHVRLRRCDLIFNLGSHVGALGNLPLGAPQVTYWNEHLTHYLSRKRAPARWVGELMQWLQYRGARQAALVMPITQAHREDLIAHGCHAERVLLVPMGVADNFALAQPTRGIPGSVLRLIYTGAVHEERGRDVMIDALCAARRRGCPVELTLVGVEAHQRPLVVERCAKQGVSGSVRLLPRVDGHCIPDFLAEADFGICLWADRTYFRFNAPTKLFEYLVAGLPVLASDIRTHTSYVRDGEHGFVFAYDAEALADAMCRAWAAREQWPRLRRAAAEQGLQYRWSAIEPHFLAALAPLHA